ncbi:MAG: VWA domain-containing protein [Planctomycetota bacterium]|nr:VWA domain-containing protein [Planctomycetota bacterium]
MRIGRIEFAILVLVAATALAAARQASAEVLFVPTDAKVRPLPIEQPEPGPGVIRPPTWRPPQPSDLPFRVTNSRVDVRIEENVATTTIEQSFLNLSGRDLEVRVMVPLPAGASINKSALSMNDEMVEGKLYNAEEAQRIYESIVQQRRDPALLRFAGENLYEARVFPIPPNQERRLKFSYDQVLSPVNGMYDFRHILAGSQLYQRGVEKFQFECVIRGKSSIGPVYSPSHKVNVARPDARTAVVKLSDTNLSTDQDFRLYYAPSTEDVSLRVVAHRMPGAPGGDEGYFMVIGRPDDQLEKDKILSKEIVFVLDTSGSMAGDKIEQARKALAFCLSQLNPQDRFNLVTFSTTVNALSDGKLFDATKENVKKALDAVDTIEATGGTAIDDALRAALAQDFTPGPGKAKLVIFLTDGLPSVGVTDAASILKDVEQGNKAQARIFNFGVGTDVNTHLLDRISMDHDGSSAYVAPKEDLELRLSDFYAKIKNPVMTNVSFDFGGDAKANSFYPKKVPALFKGSEILLFGRYKGTGPGTVTLRGNVNGESKEIKIDVEWPAQERDNSFLPRVWAMRKIGHLLEEMRLNGQNQETIGEVVALSQLHGIVTPYTSQLVLEPGMQGPGRTGRPMPMEEQAAANAPAAATAGLRRANEAAKKEAGRLAQEALDRKSGDLAVALAETEKALKDADGFAEAKQRGGNGLRDKAYEMLEPAGKNDEAAVDRIQQAAAQDMKRVGDRTFYHRGGTWVDAGFKSEEAKPTVIKAFSPEYFALLKKHAHLGAVLALGGRILVMVDGQPVQIEPAAAE